MARAGESEHTLKGIGLFATLPDRVRDLYERSCAWRRYKPEEQIIDKSSDTHDVLFIAEGSVRVVNYSLSGREISFDDLHAGDFFGELAAIDGKPRSATVVARSDTLLAIMPPEAFRSMVTEQPALALTIMRQLAKIVRVSTGRIMGLSTIAAHDRVRVELLRLARHALKPDGSARISPIPIHSDIASRVSTTRETVARVLGDLSRQGYIKREPDALVVLDFERLAESLEEIEDIEE
jgi:CRP-like cAMP-binding protein